MRKIIIALIVALLFGCELRESNNASDYSIRIVYLEDGTKCATFKYGKGISCDWSYNK